MRRVTPRQKRNSSGRPLLRAAGQRLLLSMLVLFIWSVSPEIDVQALQRPADGHGTLASVRPVVHRAALARERARHAGAETSRFKVAAYVHAPKGDGKLFGILTELLLPLQPASDAPLGAWRDTRPGLPPIHAFDARAPPTLAA
jgi:hypothetical protein